MTTTTPPPTTSRQLSGLQRAMLAVGAAAGFVGAIYGLDYLIDTSATNPATTTPSTGPGIVENVWDYVKDNVLRSKSLWPEVLVSGASFGMGATRFDVGKALAITYGGLATRAVAKMTIPAGSPDAVPADEIGLAVVLGAAAMPVLYALGSKTLGYLLAPARDWLGRP